jgi:hypothetical protein
LDAHGFESRAGAHATVVAAVNHIEMIDFSKIDFGHAFIAVMDAVIMSDNVTEAEINMVEALLLRAEAANKDINCPCCGSRNVRMTDHQPLAVNEDLLTLGQFDNELYGQFDCFDCEVSFQKTLEISQK